MSEYMESMLVPPPPGFIPSLSPSVSTPSPSDFLQVGDLGVMTNHEDFCSKLENPKEKNKKKRKRKQTPPKNGRETSKNVLTPKKTQISSFSRCLSQII